MYAFNPLKKCTKMKFVSHIRFRFGSIVNLLTASRDTVHFNLLNMTNAFHNPVMM